MVAKDGFKIRRDELGLESLDEMLGFGNNVEE